MPKLFVITTLILFTLSGFCQSKPSNEIIAEGVAKIKMKPDLATFTLTIEKTDSIEKVAISQLNETAEELTHSLLSLGFKNENIKIAGYDISSSTNHDDKKKTYTASNVLRANFRIDNKFIDAFYSEIQQTGIEDLDVSFETSISDSLEKETRLKLVQKAIEDAKRNANNIAQALGVHITKVKQVHKYGEDANESEKIEMVKFTPTEIKKDTQIRYNTPFDKF